MRLSACTALALLFSLQAAAQEGSDTPTPKLKPVLMITGYEKDRPLKDPLSLDVDRAAGSGEIVVADAGNNAIAVFGPTGRPRLRIGKSAGLAAPIGAAFDRNGEIVVAEMDSPVLKVIDVKGVVAEKIDLSAIVKDETETINPGRLCIDRDGNLHVLDRANQRIYVLDPRRRLKATFGGPGEEEGQLRMAQDLAVDQAGGVHVTGSKGVAVHLFDVRGKFVRRFGEHGYGRNCFSFPTGIAVDSKGRLWVADGFQHVVKVHDGKGKLLFEVGGAGTRPGEFDLPVDLAFDARGRLCVLEKGGGRVQVFEIEEVPAGK